jgi:hypothetical protein
VTSGPIAGQGVVPNHAGFAVKNSDAGNACDATYVELASGALACQMVERLA